MNARKPGPGQGQPPPMGMFPDYRAISKYAKEVNDLMEEIQAMRDEKRRLQYEIAELMTIKSKHGAGGEYTPSWMPMPDPAAALPAPTPPEEAPPENKGSAWRSVVRPVPRAKKRHGGPTSPKAITAGPLSPIQSPPPQPPAWAQWKPNPNVVPQPRTPAPAPVAAPPKNEGLFGPDD